MSLLDELAAKAKQDTAAIEARAREVRQQAAAGKIEVSISLAGDPVKFTCRKPTSREWQEYEGVRSNYATALAAGALTKALTKDVYDASEDLCKRLVNSHSAQQLQELDDEHLGIFWPLADQIAEAIDMLRSGMGKGSPPPGAT